MGLSNKRINADGKNVGGADAFKFIGPLVMRNVNIATSKVEEFHQPPNLRCLSVTISPDMVNTVNKKQMSIAFFFHWSSNACNEVD